MADPFTIKTADPRFNAGELVSINGHSYVAAGQVEALQAVIRCIPITSCAECPHRNHKGGLGDVAYVPVCQKANKDLPHTVGTQKTTLGHRMIASQVEGIPEWCPLPLARTLTGGTNGQ